MALSEAHELSCSKVNLPGPAAVQEAIDKQATPISLKVGDYVFTEEVYTEEDKKPIQAVLHLLRRSDATVPCVYSPMDPIHVHLARVAPGLLHNPSSTR